MFNHRNRIPPPTIASPKDTICRPLHPRDRIGGALLPFCRPTQYLPPPSLVRRRYSNGTQQQLTPPSWIDDQQWRIALRSAWTRSSLIRSGLCWTTITPRDVDDGAAHPLQRRRAGGWAYGGGQQWPICNLQTNDETGGKTSRLRRLMDTWLETGSYLTTRWSWSHEDHRCDSFSHRRRIPIRGRLYQFVHPIAESRSIPEPDARTPVLELAYDDGRG